MRKLIVAFILGFAFTSFAGPIQQWHTKIVKTRGNDGLNDFSGDSACKALWKFETGALTTDSKSTNTLTDTATVGQETVAPLEGNASASFVYTNSEYLSITDTNLASGFPIKSGAGGTFSVFFRFKSTTATNPFFSKIEYNKRTIGCELDGSNKLLFWIGVAPGGDADYEVIGPHATALTNNTEYSAVISFNNSTKAYAIRIRDASGGVVGSDLTGTTTNNINLEDAPFYIGRWEYNSGTGYYNGLMDEVVVFDDIISDTEATKLAQGIYP